MLVTDINTAQIFKPLENARGILLGLSGGPDSVAALALLSQWPHHPPVFAATFDHGLRAGSRDEANQCANLCAPFNIPHAILTWQGDKPATRIQEAAREARYGALIAYAKEIGADVLITAHHADDNLETMMMNFFRGTGIAGLRGILPRQHYLIRPLLPYRKEELLSYATQQKLKWREDSSNIKEIGRAHV